jgi:inner membrane protein
VAWDLVSIVDPLVTLPLLVGVVLAARRRSARPAALSLAYVFAYIVVWGGWQHHRAVEAVRELAAQRHHEPRRLEAFPNLASNVTWRTVYEHDGAVYVDGVHTPWFSDATPTRGDHVRLVTRADLDPAAVADPRTLEGFRTFRWFADGWIARVPGTKDVIGDVRYSADVGSVVPLWGIVLHPGQDVPITRWQWQGDVSASLRRRFGTLFGDDASDADEL